MHHDVALHVHGLVSRLLSSIGNVSQLNTSEAMVHPAVFPICLICIKVASPGKVFLCPRHVTTKTLMGFCGFAAIIYRYAGLIDVSFRRRT